MQAVLVTTVLCLGCGSGLLLGDDDDRVDGPRSADASAGEPDGGATAPSDAMDAAAGDVDAAFLPVDCSAIGADPDYELCETSADSCAGVFTDGSGCTAFCAAAGLVCTAAYGGEPGCQKEPANPLDCATAGHTSDWCECGPSNATPGECDGEPGNPPVQMILSKDQASYGERHNWVLGCYPYAYTASGAEHQSCDSEFFPDGSRTGTATFTFANVPPGSYDVHIESRHTVNRNPAGARFVVDGHVAIIWQNDDADYVWDYHGTYCLGGTVEVILDSTVNSGSDAVKAVRLSPDW